MRVEDKQIHHEKVVSGTLYNACTMQVALPTRTPSCKYTIVNRQYRVNITEDRDGRDLDHAGEPRKLRSIICPNSGNTGRINGTLFRTLLGGFP